MVATVEGDGDLKPLKVLRGGGRDRHDLPGCEFLLPLRILGDGSTVDVVDLLMSFREIALWFFGLLLLTGLLDHLEHLICETLKSNAIPGLVLSLRVENANPIQEAVFTQPGPVLLVVMQPLYVVHGAIRLLLLVVALG
jgi:hypothetical protein